MDEKNISATETQQTQLAQPAITVKSALERRVIKQYESGMQIFNNVNRKKYFELAAAKNHTGACCELAKILLQENDLEQAKYYAQQGVEAVNISAYNTNTYRPRDYENRLTNVFKKIAKWQKLSIC